MTLGSDFDSVLAAAQTGAEWAFSTIYKELNPRLVRFLQAKDREAAEDVASETWIGVARGLPSFEGSEAAFRGWLFTIARRRLIQHWRDTGRRPSQPVDPEDLVDRPGTEDPEASGVAAASAREAVAAITAALSPDQADVILLRMLADLDVNQVAEILGKRQGAVRALQHKALRRLARKFSMEVVTE